MTARYFAVFITLLLVSTSTATATEYYSFVTKWGVGSHGDGGFTDPSGVAIGTSNNVYVADTGNHRIQKFTSTGTFLAKGGEYGTCLGCGGSFNQPQGIAFSSLTRNVVVADTGNSRIQKFTDSLLSLALWGVYGYTNDKFSQPQGVACGYSSGYASWQVYVADTGNDRIQMWEGPDNLGGTFHATCDGSSWNAKFNSPSGVAVDSSGIVYVADTGNNRIQKFRFSPDPSGLTTGKFVAKWGTTGSGDGQFRSPEGIVVDSSGDVYVADTGNNRIQKFSSTGAFLAKWGASGSGDGQFKNPEGVAVDSAGNVYVADTGNNRIQKFERSSAIPPVANFAGTPTSGSAPLTVAFIDSSSNAPTSWNWNFGDGTSSTLASPPHTYTNAGTYTVSLTVTNSVGSDALTQTNFITVAQGVLPLPGVSNPPDDPDGDGHHEDINANGRMDFSDVVLYFNQMSWIAANEPLSAFDYNGNGRIDFADVVWLFNNL